MIITGISIHIHDIEIKLAAFADRGVISHSNSIGCVTIPGAASTLGKWGFPSAPIGAVISNVARMRTHEIQTVASARYLPGHALG